MNRKLSLYVIFALIVALPALGACTGITPSAPRDGILALLPTETGIPCEACAQATLAMALTRERSNADNQAAATAEILRANAQATLNSANATLSAAQTQDQNNANVVAAQLAATAEVVRANAQATLNSAGSTQSAARTQDAINQTQMANRATTGAQAVMDQQNRDELLAGEFAAQTQIAVATSQWYDDQARQREEKRQGSIAFLWMWCLPVFALLLAGLILWGFWRWLKIQQANQRILKIPVETLQAPPDSGASQDGFLPPGSDIINGRYRLSQPDDQMRGWMDEIKRKLLNREKDKDDYSDG